MRRRLYFVLPDRQSAETIERELLLAKIDDHHIHFMAKEGVQLGRLSRANLLQKTDLVHGMEIGLAAGGVTGILLGMALFLWPQIGNEAGLGLVLLLALAGGAVGAWASGMIAISVPNSRLRRFEPAMNRGHLLLMVDVPLHRMREIRQLILEHHPEAESGGQDTQIPAFP